MNKKQTGCYGEFLARMYMRLHGYRIMQKDYVTKKARAGEVDFIAIRGKTLVFVEVKTRKKLEDAAYAIKHAQQNRITAAAVYYLQKYPKYGSYNIRFDAILVQPLFRLRHIKNAWDYDQNVFR